MSHSYQEPKKVLNDSLPVKPIFEPGSDAEIDINWVLYSPSNPFDCVLVTSMKKQQMSLPFGHLRSFFKILLRREAQRVTDFERIRFWKLKDNLSIFQISEGWTAALPNLKAVATELPLPAKFRMVTPARSAVDDGSGNVHVIITINPKLNLIEEEGVGDRYTPAELFVNPIYMQATEPQNASVDEPRVDIYDHQTSIQSPVSAPQTVDDHCTADKNIQIVITATSTQDVHMHSTTSINPENVTAEAAAAPLGSTEKVPEFTKPESKKKKGKIKLEKNRLRARITFVYGMFRQAERNNLRAARHTLRISAAPGTTIVLPPKVPPHNKKEMDQEKARLIKQLDASGSKVSFLGPRETFPDRTGDPPPCYVCKEPVKAPPAIGMLALERTLFSGYKAFRSVPGESTHDADERNEKTLKDRVLTRCIYYHWSCIKDPSKRHFIDTPPIRHSSVDSQNWERVLNDIMASTGEGRHHDGEK
ncbi:hypothetical protein ARMGADRAFT_1064488 [Armillaria gallica]|uniref:Uncharacterized protein n=1 Tax=Armillaria gallica TaxID=47427 RepID=A0A2H3D518_ARMGA|nr:hypothetical protein ARMGADRAFT_1064488 [Armillaria gallica]